MRPAAPWRRSWPAQTRPAAASLPILRPAGPLPPTPPLLSGLHSHPGAACPAGLVARPWSL